MCFWRSSVTNSKGAKVLSLLSPRILIVAALALAFAGLAFAAHHYKAKYEAERDAFVAFQASVRALGEAAKAKAAATDAANVQLKSQLEKQHAQIIARLA